MMNDQPRHLMEPSIYGRNFLDETSLDLRKYSGHSSSFCSGSCSSLDSDLSDEEDSLLRWPWIPHILENGNLFYLEPWGRTGEENGDTKELDALQTLDFTSEKDEVKKISKGLGKIKEAILRKKAIGKSEKEYDISKDRTQAMQDGFLEPKSSGRPLPQAVDDTCQPYKYMNGHNGVWPHCNQGLKKSVVVKLSTGAGQTDSDLLSSKLGISIFSMSSKHELGKANETDVEEVVIQDILPAGPCSHCPEIKLGDRLLTVNGIEVSLKTIDSVLAQLLEQSEVELVLEEGTSHTAKQDAKSRLLSLISGSPEANRGLMAQTEMACLGYLTLEGKEDDKDSDILFWYPKRTSKDKLKIIRGMFLTLGDLMDSVTGTPVLSSTLIVDGKAIHVCYAKEKSNILVLAAPAKRASVPHLHHSLQELVRLLCLLYGSLDSSFDESANDDVEHLVMLFMEGLLGGMPKKSKVDTAAETANSFHGVRQLCLSSQHKVWISNTLSDAEAADYGECADDFFPHRRLYSTLGTCLFYKGHLVCNHLHEEDTVDFLLYCKHYGLLRLNETLKVNQLVIWREIFPTRRRRQAPPSKGSFEEPHGRWYFLAVSQKQSLLCILLEAGGVASTPLGNPGPHPYYVDTAASILAYMQEHFDFETICEAKLRAAAVPSLAALDDLGTLKSGRQSPVVSPVDVAPRKLPAHLQHMVNRTPLSPFEQVKLSSTMTPDDRSIPSHASSPLPLRRHSSLASEDSSGGSGSFSRAHLSGSVASVRKSMAGGISEEFSAMVSTKLTAGVQNVLFYYTSLNTAKGVLVCPKYNFSPDNLGAKLLEDFRLAAERIRAMFERHQRVTDTFPQKNGAKNGISPQTARESVMEQGVLFRLRLPKSLESKKQGNFIKYWVVGRLLVSNSKQLYVCFREGTPQNVVELGFKLGFGAC